MLIICISVRMSSLYMFMCYVSEIKQMSWIFSTHFVFCFRKNPVLTLVLFSNEHGFQPDVTCIHQAIRTWVKVSILIQGRSWYQYLIMCLQHVCGFTREINDQIHVILQNYSCPPRYFRSLRLISGLGDCVDKDLRLTCSDLRRLQVAPFVRHDLKRYDIWQCLTWFCCILLNSRRFCSYSSC